MCHQRKEKLWSETLCWKEGSHLCSCAALKVSHSFPCIRTDVWQYRILVESLFNDQIQWICDTNSVSHQTGEWCPTPTWAWTWHEPDFQQCGKWTTPRTTVFQVVLVSIKCPVTAKYASLLMDVHMLTRWTPALPSSPWTPHTTYRPFPNLNI